MLKFNLEIAVCPTCGSDKIKRVKRDLKRTFKGVDYTVPSLEFYECPNCGEKLFDREAMRKIEAHSPAYKETVRKKVA
ncbi:MAG: type II toxin-antitoxin system MqsA family antitoxin [Blastocatellia bacterium]